MIIAITGASGMIGSYLTKYFTNRGDTIIPLYKELFAYNSVAAIAAEISQAEVVINLAGAPIDHRWTKEYKKRIYNSRVETTQMVVEAINRVTSVKLLISASAVGYYPSWGCFDESSQEMGDTFLSDVCRAWEEAAKMVKDDVRCVITRFGVVFSQNGGAFEKMRSYIKLGLNITIGDQENTISWIDIKDLSRAMEFIIDNCQLKGGFNFSSPTPLSEAEMATLLAKHYNTHINIHLPKSVARFAVGESSSVITTSSCVFPKRLIEAGFRFTTPDMATFLKKLDQR